MGVRIDSARDEEVDWLVADYFMEQVDDGPFSMGSALALLGALRHRNPRRFLPVAGSIVAEWRKDRPPEQAVALPAEVVYAGFVVLWSANRRAVATVMLVAFCGLLRVGEALGLRRQMIIFQPPERPSSAILLLGKAKRGHDDQVELRNPVVIRALQCAVLTWSNSPNDLLFDVSYSTFSRYLMRTVEVLGLDASRVRSHSLRRGGATELYHAGLDLDSIIVFGRWASDRSARLYIKAAEPTLLRSRSALTGAQWRVVVMLGQLAGDLVAASRQ